MEHVLSPWQEESEVLDCISVSATQTRATFTSMCFFFLYLEIRDSKDVKTGNCSAFLELKISKHLRTVIGVL